MMPPASVFIRADVDESRPIECQGSPRVRDATVAIGAVTYNSAGQQEFALSGSGIVVGLPGESSNNAWLVTAKRVLAARPSVQLRFAWFSERPLNEYLGIPLQLQSGTRQQLWIAHPDATVDLAAVQLVMPKGADTGRSGLPTIPLENLAAAEDVFGGAAILALGYPQLEPQFRTRSTVRSGVVAWTDERDPFSRPLLIDAMILPGNIGGQCSACQQASTGTAMDSRQAALLSWASSPGCSSSTGRSSSAMKSGALRSRSRCAVTAGPSDR
jgi:hypothetical protein